MAKLPQGIRKRDNGIYEKRFTVNGTRYSIYGNSVKEIQEKELEARQKIAQGTYKDNRNITLDEYVEVWKSQKRQYNKANSLRAYTAMYDKHIKDLLGNVKIQALEKRHCQELQKKANITLSASSTNYVMTVLKMILNSAIDDEIITRNVAKSIKPLSNDKGQKAAETKHRALTEEEQRAFMTEAKKMDSYYYELYATMLMTGARIGEIACITWNDIDFKRNVIYINKTVSADENGKKIINNTPKTKTSKREIPLKEPLKAILKAQRIKSTIIYSVNGYNINTPLFCTVNGNVASYHTVNLDIKRIVKKLREKGFAISDFTCHAFRDTFATRFIEQGGNPQTLKTILGHSSLAMTMDLYAQVLPNTKQAEMEKVQIII